MIPSELPSDVRKILSRWARDDYYVYLRPMSSAYVDPGKKETTYWVVSVEYRAVEFKQVKGEGYDLCEVLRKMAPDVPRRRDVQPGYRPGKTTGWLAARAAADAEKAHYASQPKPKKKNAGKPSKGKLKVKKPSNVVDMTERLRKKKKRRA